MTFPGAGTMMVTYLPWPFQKVPTGRARERGQPGPQSAWRDGRNSPPGGSKGKLLSPVQSNLMLYTMSPIHCEQFAICTVCGGQLKAYK